MPNVTVFVSDDLKKEMDENSLINWSEVARRAFTQQLRDLKLLEEITSKSKATDKDVEELSLKVKKGVAKRYGLRG